MDGEEQICFVACELNRVLNHSPEEINVSDILQRVIKKMDTINLQTNSYAERLCRNVECHDQEWLAYASNNLQSVLNTEPLVASAQ